MAINRTIDSDPPEGNTYDVVRHFQTSAALKNINDQIATIGASHLHATSWSGY